jgi:hypothetical protein
MFEVILDEITFGVGLSCHIAELRRNLVLRTGQVSRERLLLLWVVEGRMDVVGVSVVMAAGAGEGRVHNLIISSIDTIATFNHYSKSSNRKSKFFFFFPSSSSIRSYKFTTFFSFYGSFPREPCSSGSYKSREKISGASFFSSFSG